MCWILAGIISVECIAYVWIVSQQFGIAGLDRCPICASEDAEEPIAPVCSPMINTVMIHDTVVTTRLVERDAYRSGIRGVGSVWVVTLETRSDRRERMRILLGSLGIHPKLVKAIGRRELIHPAPAAAHAQTTPPADGRWWEESEALTGWRTKIDVEQSLGNYCPECNTEEARLKAYGAIGCWQSHLRLMSEICRSNDTALVFEDDIDVPTDIVPMIEDLVGRVLPRDWLILKLDHRGYDKIGKVYRPPDVRYMTGFTGTTGYVVTPEAACLLKESLDRSVPAKAVDIWIGHILRDAGLFPRSFVLVPGVIYHDDRPGSDIRKGTTKWEPLQNGAAARVVALMEFKLKY
jgi:GR25 family glycosyltransferase involved in LPS biosynthesis